MSSSFSVEKIAQILGAEFIGTNKNIVGVKSLRDASENDIAFFANHRYVNDLKVTLAGACLIKSDDIGLLPTETTAILCNNPHLAFAHILDIFYPSAKNEKTDISSNSYISPSATIGEKCIIRENVCIGDDSIIGNSCFIDASAHIGENVRIGNNVIIGANASLKNCEIGDNVCIYSGVRIGEDGFGFILDEKHQLKKIQQIGRVIIGNNVEIGANTCIDRGALENTIIGENTKIDNLVQIGHNVIIGKNCIICAQVGIAGSTVIQDYVMIGGQAGINGHIEIGNRVQIAAKSGVLSSLSDGEKVGGYPAMKIQDWHKQSIFLKNAIKK